MFDATLRRSDPDRWLRGVLTAVTLGVLAALAGVAWVVALLARLTAELLLALLRAWLGIDLAPYLFVVAVPEPIEVVEVVLDAPLDPAPDARLEPDDLLASGAPDWRAALPPEPAPVRPSDLQMAGLLGILTARDSGLTGDSQMASLFGPASGDRMLLGALGSDTTLTDVLGSTDVARLGAIGPSGGGLGDASLGGGLGELRGGGGGGMGTRGGGGGMVGTAGLGGIGSPIRKLRGTHPSAPTEGVTCRVRRTAGAPADAPPRVTVCDAAFFEVARRVFADADLPADVPVADVRLTPP